MDLEKPTRQRRAVNLSRIDRHDNNLVFFCVPVNLSRIDRYTKENEIIVVPGKVLGSGDLNHKLTIAAYQFSEGALEKLEKAGANVVSLLELSKESPDGKRIKIIG